MYNRIHNKGVNTYDFVSCLISVRLVLLLKSVGLAFRVAWCAIKVDIAAVLFMVALPLMVVGLLIGSIIKLALPLLLIAAAFYLLKSCA